MRRALRLAERGFTPPNPMVGCVLVRDGKVVGEGYHRAAGLPHAEAEAVAVAGGSARGATAYVSLEPCAHTGRTSPCSRALIEAGIRRVVAAVQDPNPVVAGKGAAELRAAGIEVELGLMEAEARELNRAFFHFHATGMPFVTLKAAMSLDGKIATRTGDSKWITSEAARRYVHRLRAQSGAVLCGIGTVLADDSLLTARIPGVPRQPLRVVLDSDLRTPPESRLARSAGEIPTLIAVARGATGERAQELRAQGVEVLGLPRDASGRVLLQPLLEELGRREVISVLVEGGGETHAAFIEQRLFHRMMWFIAPKLIGGRSAPSSVEGTGAEMMDNAARLERLKVRRIGPDLLIETGPLNA